MSRNSTTQRDVTARRAAAEVGLLDMTATEWRTSVIADEPSTEGAYEELQISNLARLVDDYDRQPSIEIASRLRRIRVWMAHRNLASLRRIGAELNHLEAILNAAEAHIEAGRLDPSEIEFVEENIKRAGEDFIVMWPIRSKA
ncbi:hypothetical protein DDP54_03800 [Cellulomonas sp. WB94]|uniref:hypothetical protein n=1 Tax=Cellulomonas sp. WB94 TaxID=2173174 RepID=UPI000D567BC0|nr:hypothetical protein [Cellulomonas sp. WB94]PVU82268.1 hypothetical protein DDP54_03800 [Cellulomonas sp. WB94]